MHAAGVAKLWVLGVQYVALQVFLEIGKILVFSTPTFLGPIIISTPNSLHLPLSLLAVMLAQLKNWI